MSREPRQPFSLDALLQVTRFWNLVIVGVAQYFTAICLIGTHTFADFRLLLLSLSTILIAAAGYIINDYYDVKIDLINKPNRVVIGRSITRRYALLFHSMLSVVGILIGFFLGWKIGLINFFSVFLLWWYSNSLKRQPFIGNFSVALLTGMTVFLINVLYHYQPLITVYASFAFSMTLVREIIKDIEDLKGDNTFGCKTLPILWGIRQTKLFLYFLLIVFSATVVFVNLNYKQLPDPYFLFALFLPLVFFVAKLARADTKRDFYVLSQWCKFIMLLGIAGMVFI